MIKTIKAKGSELTTERIKADIKAAKAEGYTSLAYLHDPILGAFLFLTLSDYDKEGNEKP